MQEAASPQRGKAQQSLVAENVVSKNLGSPVYLDEFYTYDGLNRLKNFDRGELNGGYTAITGTPSAEEDWSLDPLGNWSGYVQKTSGSTDLDQARAVNKANEISNITETTGDSWATPAYDLAGNMTSVPKPVDLTASYDCTYDAWNRLVKIVDDSFTIGVNEFDALMRRCKDHIDSGAPNSPNGVDSYLHRFYNSGWQLVEERQAVSEGTQPEAAQPKSQRVWSPRYVDAQILMDDNEDADGLCDDVRTYFCTDANMNISSVLSADGTATEYVSYSLAGHIQFRDAACEVISASTTQNDAWFSGAQYDDASHLTGARARMYHASTGTYLARDPLVVRGANSYSYAGNNGPNHVDPLGLFHQSSVSGYIANPMEEALAVHSVRIIEQANQQSASQKTNTCVVILMCNRLGIPKGPKHCGVEILDSKGKTKFHVFSGTCKLHDARPEFGWSSEYWVAWRQILPATTCACIRRTAALISSKNLKYKMIPESFCRNSPEPSCNSNYTAKCLLAKCGAFEVSTPEFSLLSGGNPVGWLYRMRKCVRKRFTCAVKGDAHCTCDKWEYIDSAWCANVS